MAAQEVIVGLSPKVADLERQCAALGEGADDTMVATESALMRAHELHKSCQNIIEELMRQLETLDGLTVGSDEEVRIARKKLVNRIQRVMAGCDELMEWSQRFSTTTNGARSRPRQQSRDRDHGSATHEFCHWTGGLLPPPSAFWLERTAESPAETVFKSLNIGHRYADHLAPSVKEHIQNWRDQICSLGGRVHGGVDFDPFTDLALKSTPLPEGHRWAFECSGRTLGWLMLQRPSGGGNTCRLFLCNYVTVLSLNILTLGHTNKRDAKWVAGFFGEGVKVEINRLAQAGADVRYYTGSHEWTFSYEQQGPDHVLSVRQTPISASSRDRLPREIGKAAEPWHTLIVLDKLPGAALFQPDQFVFLCHPRQELLCNDGTWVLLDVQLARRIYVQGIFVQDIKDPITWAFDYRGHKAPPELQMGRDRDHMDVDAFFARLSSLYSAANMAVNSADGLLSVFTGKLYDYLAYSPREGESNGRTQPCIPWFLEPTADQLAMAKALLGVFTDRHGPNAVPAELKPQSSKENEADLLTVELVRTQPLLLAWLRMSPECPTLESMWQQRVKGVLTLPEFAVESEPRPPYPCQVIPLSGDMATLAVSLRAMVETFFAPRIRGHQVRFKHFPSPRATNRRLLQLEWEGVNYYILNDHLIHPGEVHFALKRADSTFACLGGACGCVRDIIVSDLLELLPPADARAIERYMRRKLLAIYDNNLIAPPAPDVLPPDELRPRRTAKRPASRMERDSAQSAAHGDDVVERESTGPQRGVADGAPDAYRSDVQRCMASTNATTADAINLPGRPETQIFNHRCTVPEQSKLNIRRSAVSGIMGIAVWAEERNVTSLGAAHPLQQKPPVVTDELMRFAQTLLLCRDTFALDLGHINIVWEDSERVAFNLGPRGSLFFNLRYAEAWMAKSASPLELLDYWFVIMCHELAHNAHSQHGAAHARVMGALVSARLPAFHQLRQAIERGGFNSWRAFDHQRPSS